MKKRGIYPIIVIIAAIAVMAVRLWELSAGFGDGGITTDHVSVSATHFVAAAAVLVCAVLGAIAAPKCFDFQRCMCVGVGKLTLVAAGFLLAACGLVGLMTRQGEMSRMVLSAFAIFGGACMILSISARGGALAIVPVFFGCFLMLVLYVEHAGDAVLERYSYHVLAAAAGTMVLYSAASSAYRMRRSRFRLAACGMATVLTAVAAATAVIDRDIQLAVGFAALFVLALGEMLAVCLNGLDEDIEEPEESEDGEDNPDSDDTAPSSDEGGVDFGDATWNTTEDSNLGDTTGDDNSENRE